MNSRIQFTASTIKSRKLRKHCPLRDESECHIINDKRVLQIQHVLSEQLFLFPQTLYTN